MSMFRPIPLAAAMLLTSIASAIGQSLELRVMSFNIRYINPGDQGERSWLARRDDVAQVIREDHADVVGLQEAFRPMLDDIAARVPGYSEVGVGREDGVSRGEHAAILFRTERFDVLDSGTFWLSDTPEVPGSATWKNVVTRICTWAKLEDKNTKKQFIFCNTHLDHESQESREKGVALILERMEAHGKELPIVLTGDFNVDEENPVVKNLTESGFLDAWRKLHPDVPKEESGTFNQFTGVKNTGKIDYIFVKEDAEVLDSAILHNEKNGVFPSDHFPVRATLRY